MYNKLSDDRWASIEDSLCNVISFLRENEEYGDDWKEEIYNLTVLLGVIYDERSC